MQFHLGSQSKLTNNNSNGSSSVQNEVTTQEQITHCQGERELLCKGGRVGLDRVKEVGGQLILKLLCVREGVSCHNKSQEDTVFLLYTTTYGIALYILYIDVVTSADASVRSKTVEVIKYEVILYK